jgi:preprotein translocase subunit SecD
MRKNLTTKTIFIIGVLLVFTYGIFFGTNPEQSWAAMKDRGPLAAIEQNIHRGLDLKGGTHLILQVMVNEAVAAESQRTADQLKEELNKSGVAFTDISVPNSAGQPELI